MQIERLDHLVLTVADIAVTCDFYTSVLGVRVFHFGEGRTALGFGQQKINLHQSGREFEPKAAHVMPGSADLCFILATPLTEIIRQLEICNVPIEIGPVERTGATGRIMSVYIRDPDGNLLELSNLLES